jgi:hypothetical protein
MEIAGTTTGSNTCTSCTDTTDPSVSAKKLQHLANKLQHHIVWRTMKGNGKEVVVLYKSS